MTTTLLAGVGAAALVCCSVLATYLVTRRARRVDTRARDVQEVFDPRPWPAIGDPLAVTNLDEVLQWTLSAAAAIDGADAALVACEDVEGSSLIVSSGLDSEEARRYKLSAAPDGRVPQAVEFVYRHAGDETQRVLHGAVAVPLVHDDRLLGWIAVFSFENAGTGDVLRQLERLSVRATTAIEIALRFREIRRLAETDPLTGLHNRRYFHESLAREISRAQRYERRLSMIFFDLDDFKAINDRVGHLAGDAVLAEAAARILTGVRSADITCRIGGDEFAVILTETGAEEAEQLKRRIESAVSARPLTNGVRVSLSGGVAELAAEEDAASLITRANEAGHAAKADRRQELDASRADASEGAA